MTVYLWIVCVTTAIFLAASICVLLRAGSPRVTKEEQRDYRVVHFTLRLALILGIGAVIMGVLLVAMLLGLQFTA